MSFDILFVDKIGVFLTLIYMYCYRLYEALFKALLKCLLSINFFAFNMVFFFEVKGDDLFYNSY